MIMKEVSPNEKDKNISCIQKCGSIDVSSKKMKRIKDDTIVNETTIKFMLSRFVKNEFMMKDTNRVYRE